MSRYIKLESTEARIEIAKHFGITTANVSQILRFRRDGVNAEKVREMAKEKGGKLINEVEVEDIRTIKVLDSKGKIKQIINQ